MRCASIGRVDQVALVVGRAIDEALVVGAGGGVDDYGATPVVEKMNSAAGNRRARDFIILTSLA